MEAFECLSRAFAPGSEPPGSDEAHLLGVQSAAFARLLSTLRCGLGLAPRPSAADPPAEAGLGRPPVPASPKDAGSYPPFAALCGRFGFVPNLFRAQTLRPSALEVEVDAVERLLSTSGLLSRERRELILLAVSTANRSLYGATLHTQLLATLGLPEEAADRITADPPGAGLPEEDAALLGYARALAGTAPGSPGLDVLVRAGFTRLQALEATAVAALGNFLDALAEGLGTAPDFPPRERLRANLFPGVDRPTSDEALRPERPRAPDPDAPLVARCRAGDVDGFEELVRRHQGRVYRTLLSITGNAADAEDGAQRAFLNAYQRLPGFEGASTFATWITRIAINEGLERLRSRRPTESLDEPGGEESRVAPRQIRAWGEDPEEAYARKELRAIVEREILRLPAAYRVVLLLRDIEELPTQEAAAVLGVGVPTLKTRLLRGRLMLREALTPYFAASGRAQVV